MVAKQHPFSVRSSDIGRLVNKFDFSQVSFVFSYLQTANTDNHKMNVRDSTREDHLHVNLAPAYGNLTQQSIKTMDKQLLVMIGVTIRKLRSIPPKKRTWETVVASMNQNCAIKPRGPPLEKNDKYKNEGNHFMKVDDSPDPSIVKEVRISLTPLSAISRQLTIYPCERTRLIPGLIDSLMIEMCASP